MVRITRARLLRELVLLAWVLTMLGQYRPGSAQTTPEATHTYSFGQTATFELRAPALGDPAAARLYLRYRHAGELTTTAHKAQAVAATTLRHERDLRELPFPPFGQIAYWWEYTDAAGQGQLTTPQTFYYEDQRFTWKVFNDVPLTWHWVAEEQDLMLAALAIGQQALDDISRALQISLTEPLHVYIYPSPADLQSALRLGGRDWIGGEAQPELGVALLGIPASSTAFTQMQRDIPHELAHLALYQYTGDYGYTMLPAWLLEGLASHFEQRPDPLYAVTLEQARNQGRLLSFPSLCGAFPPEREAALLAYAQSASFVSYLRQTYGWSGIRALLDAYRDGQGCGEGVQVLGRDLPALERAWRVWLEQGGTTGNQQQQFWITVGLIARAIAPWLLLWGVLLLPGMLVYLRSRRSPVN